MMPTTAAGPGSMTSAPALMLTSPASKALAMESRSIVRPRLRRRLTASAVAAAAAAATMVVMALSAARCARSSVAIPSDALGLKPNQPTNRSNVPVMTVGTCDVTTRARG